MQTNSKEPSSPNDLYDYLKVDKDLVTGFSIQFSRFEYALKRAGYCKQCKNAKPDWKRFAQEHEKLFDAKKDGKLETAVQYLRAKPPKKQVQENGKLGWQAVEKKSAQLEQILCWIKTIRNNLFHGGKFPSGPVDEPGRDTKLLENCVAILRECLSLDKEVQRYFGQKD